MTFDPDAYLAGSSGGGFDPDAYLASSPPPAAPKARKPSVWENNPMVNAPGIGPMLKAGYGLMEAGAELGTGLASQAVGGLGGLMRAGYDMSQGKSFDDAVSSGANVVRGVSDFATYEPRTEQGKQISKAVTYLPEKLVEGGRWAGGGIGEAVGGEKGRIAGEELGGAGMQALMTVAPAPKLLKKAREAGQPSAYQTARDTYPAKASELKQDVTLAAQREAAEAAKRQGVVVDLPDLETGRGAKINRATAREADVQRVMAERNKGVPEIKLKEEVGIPFEESLTPDAILKSREALAGPKNAIVGMEGFLDDGKTVAEIRGLVPERTVGMGKEHAAALDKVKEIVNDITTGTGTGKWVMGSIESLRKAARDIYGRSELSPEMRNTAEIYQGTANALEGLLERNLSKTAPDLLNQYRANRQKMAQSYLLEDIFDVNTGKVDLNKLSNLTKNDTSVTGAFKDFGKIYANSPESFKRIQKESDLTRLSRTTIPGAAGAMIGSILGPLGTAGGIAVGEGVARGLSKRAAKILASPEHQAKYTALKGAPTRTALGYAEAPPPLSLTSDTSPVGGMGGTQLQPSGRSMLDVGIAETPEGTPLSKQLRARHDVPTMEFKLRQELLQQPEVVAAVEAFGLEAERLKGLVDNSQGFWKKKYQDELSMIENAFGDEMRRYGIDNPQEAIGFQKLYQGGSPDNLPPTRWQGSGTKLPIEKTFTLEALRRDK